MFLRLLLVTRNRTRKAFKYSVGRIKGSNYAFVKDTKLSVQKYLYTEISRSMLLDRFSPAKRTDVKQV